MWFQVNIKSLEDVIRKYLQLAESQTEAAREESHQAVIDVDDLDVIQTPEKYVIVARLPNTKPHNVCLFEFSVLECS